MYYIFTLLGFVACNLIFFVFFIIFRFNGFRCTSIILQRLVGDVSRWSYGVHECEEYIILVREDCTFEQFLKMVYEVLQVNLNEYSLTMKTTLRSSNTMYRVCSLPINIFNDEIVNVVLHMASDVVNYGCIPIFVTTYPRVPAENLEPLMESETSFRANKFVPDIEEEVLPQQMSFQQCYSPLNENNDTIGDNDIMLADVEEDVLS